MDGQNFLDDYIINILYLISEYENKCNELKKALTGLNEYNQGALFNYISRNGLISSKEILSFYIINKKKEYIDIDVIKFIISCYDIDNDGSLNYTEFNSMIRNKTENVKNITGKKMISDNVKALFVNLICIEYDYANRLNSVISRLSTKFKIDIEKLFSCLDFHKKNYLTESNFKCYLQLNNVVFKDEEIRNLFNRLDINNDGIVSLNEFKNFFAPKKFTKSTEKEDFEITIERNNTIEVSESLKKKTIGTFNNLTLSERIEAVEVNTTFLPIFKNVRDCKLEEDMFRSFVKDLVRRYKKIESLKCQLTKRYDFNLLDVFSIFNRLNSRSITLDNFRLGFNTFDVYPTDVEFNLIFQRFSNKRLGIDYENFIHMFLPIEKEYNEILRTRPSNPKCEFSNETRELIKELLFKFIKNESESENWRVKLNQMPLFNTRTIFESIVRYKDDNILISDLELFFDKSDMVRDDYMIIFSIFDKNKDNKISYYEFYNELFPKMN